MTFDNQLIGHDKYISVVEGNRKYLIEDFQTLEGCFVFATKSSTLALKDLISKDYYSFESFENNNYIVFEDGFPIDEFVYFKVLSPMEIISIPFTFDKISSITPNALNANFKAFEDLCVVMQGLLNERVLRIDKTNSDCMLPELEANEVWKRTEDGKGWEGYDLTLIERTIQEFWDKLYEETRRITEEFRKELGDYTEELKKELNNEGLKLLVNSPNHGFLFDAVQYTSDGKYVKTDANNFADGIAERIDDNNFYLVSNGKITIPAGAKDSSGKDLVEDEYYFLDENVAGGFTPIKPIHIYQPLFLVAKDKGKLRALIEVETPVDLRARILNDEFDEEVARVVKAVNDQAEVKIQEIRDMTYKGVKIRVAQTGHGFNFTPIALDRVSGRYVKASRLYPAEGMAVGVDDNTFEYMIHGILEIPAGAKDSSGNDFVVNEYYFMDDTKEGRVTPIKPSYIFQPVFSVTVKDGVKVALIAIDTPIDLTPRILEI